MMSSLSTQLAFDDTCPVTDAVERLANNGGIEERGAIFTRREVVDFILDLVGYTVDQPLATFRLLEPSFGGGDFLLPAVERLLAAAAREKGGLAVERLAPAIRGVELHRKTYEHTRQSLQDVMANQGLAADDADALLDSWLLQSDFLLCDLNGEFTHVVGNPPYVRLESVPDILMGEYRRRYGTIYDRADIYVPFFERSLRLLGPSGKLGFICADRWMKNRYGRKLREFVGRAYHMAAYIDMVGTDAFHSEVSAYPAITVIERQTPGQTAGATRLFKRPEINGEALTGLARELTMPKLNSSSKVREVESIASGGEPWILENFDALALVRRLESAFPSIEEAGCKVGIGVATGADKAFTGEFEELDVESCRKLPLVMTRDIVEGRVKWRGKGVVNPFGDDGEIVELEDYPRLARYFEERYDKIAGRHVATRTPRHWYRTIDRIDPGLAGQEKLLIPDIKGDATIVHEQGKFYPHHNLYYITSDEWDLQALQAVMRSGIARLFVSLYSTKMRGGYLRFQAQHLRRIRLPSWDRIGKAEGERLKRLAEAGKGCELNDAVAAIYGLSKKEIALVERGGAE